MNDIRVVVAGAAGRMGLTIIRLLAESNDLVLAGALEAPHHPDLGQDAATLAGLKAAGIVLTDDPLPAIASAHAIIDFTVPKVSVELAALAAQARIVHVIGTTGLAAADETKIAAAARHAVIVKSSNMSLGVSLLAALVKKAARALPEFDIEIVEMHHRNKVDAPSGTALLLGHAAAEGRNIALESHSMRGRDGITGKRNDGAIGFASLRGGTVVGEHEVILAGRGEKSRSCMLRKTARFSRKARSRQCVGASAKSPDSMRWRTSSTCRSDRAPLRTPASHACAAIPSDNRATRRQCRARDDTESDRRSDCARRPCRRRGSFRRTDPLRDRTIRRDAARRDCQQRLPHFDLPGNAQKVQPDFACAFSVSRKDFAHEGAMRAGASRYSAFGQRDVISASIDGSPPSSPKADPQMPMPVAIARTIPNGQGSKAYSMTRPAPPRA